MVDVFLTRCRISMCQGLGQKKHDEISEIDRTFFITPRNPDAPFRMPLLRSPELVGDRRAPSPLQRICLYKGFPLIRDFPVQYISLYKGISLDKGFPFAQDLVRPAALGGQHAQEATILYYIILYCTVLYYTILYYTILYCTILYYTILYYTILYYTVLYYTVLYCTVLYWLYTCTHV